MNSSSELVALVPTGVVTVTSAMPDPAGEVTLREVGELTLTPVPALAPKLTVVAPATKPVPVTLTEVLPPATPVTGLTAVTVGTAAKLKWSAAEVELVPAGVTTVMSTVPAASDGDMTAVSCVGEV